MAGAAQALGRPRRIFSAYGSLDKKARHWRYLPPVTSTCGAAPRGEELVYRLNETTLEVGQGGSTLRGYISVAMLPASLLGTYALWFGLRHMIFPSGVGPVEAVGLGMTVFLYAGYALGIPLVVFAFLAWFNDYFGYIDAPVRFDRVRRKVYVWSARPAGPVELAWDEIKPVAQSVSAPPYQLNSFRSVLLVDEDERGDVRFEGRVPRIAQIGAAVLDREHTLAAYEFVRVFMERGPDALPPVQQHLVWRRGARGFVDIFGFLKGSVRDWPERPARERSLATMVLGVAVMTIVAPLAWPFQLSQGIAQRTTRVPVWPVEYEQLATQGGVLRSPPGSAPDDPPLRPHEKLVAALWVGSALGVYGLLAWRLFGR